MAHLSAEGAFGVMYTTPHICRNNGISLDLDLLIRDTRHLSGPLWPHSELLSDPNCAMRL